MLTPPPRLGPRCADADVHHPHFLKNAFDAGEDGLGRNAHSLDPDKCASASHRAPLRMSPAAPYPPPLREPFDCLAYRFDIVLRGRRQTHFETRPEGA